MWKKNIFACYYTGPSPTPPSLPTIPADNIGSQSSDVWVIKTKK